MSALLKQLTLGSVNDEIQFHPAWVGNLPGLTAEKMLRGKKQSFLYVLRQGEDASSYYITYVAADFTIKHTPFVITNAHEGWYCENGCSYGPLQASIDDILHLIMYCNKDAPVPYIHVE